MATPSPPQPTQQTPSVKLDYETWEAKKIPLDPWSLDIKRGADVTRDLAIMRRAVIATECDHFSVTQRSDLIHGMSLASRSIRRKSAYVSAFATVAGGFAAAVFGVIGTSVYKNIGGFSLSLESVVIGIVFAVISVASWYWALGMAMTADDYKDTIDAYEFRRKGLLEAQDKQSRDERDETRHTKAESDARGREEKIESDARLRESTLRTDFESREARNVDHFKCELASLRDAIEKSAKEAREREEATIKREEAREARIPALEVAKQKALSAANGRMPITRQPHTPPVISGEQPPASHGNGPKPDES